jgi:type VI secretion system FHA domain protein
MPPAEPPPAPVRPASPPPRAAGTPAWTPPVQAPPAAAPPTPAPPPAAASPRPDLGIDLTAVLEGAGVPASVLTPELARDFGRILRVVVEGMMDVLQARQRIKDEFRMRVTSFKPTQNNPLKFSANVDDALHNLLVKKNPAYLGAVDAFEDAFDDVRHHQMAMLAGVRVAFEAMLKAFDPAELRREFDRQGKASLLAGPGKLRYWDQYCSRFSDMVSDADACFRELFGHEFARAYEEQLERLKAQGRSRGSRS